jgi:hypothetical protein
MTGDSSSGEHVPGQAVRDNVDANGLVAVPIDRPTSALDAVLGVAGWLTAATTARPIGEVGS